jgi:RHS repeat-associated protein
VVQTSYTYEPFGRTTVSGTSSTNPFAFTGREEDSTGALSLYHHRARYYSASLQRFLSEDPIGFAGGDANLYGYVGNGPTARRDELGLKGGSGGRKTSACPESVGYYDLNVTGNSFFALTGGVIWNADGFRGYFGVGLAFPPGLSFSFTWTRSSPTEGLNVGLQGQSGGAYQAGHSFGTCGGGFSEIGGGWPPGLSGTAYVVLPSVEPMVTGLPGPLSWLPWL